MTPTEYRSIRAINATAIKAGRKSMMHMHHVLTGGKTDTTAAMSHGTAVHALLFQPDNIAVWMNRRAGKDWEAFAEENKGKVILTTAESARAVDAVNAIRANKDAANLLAGCTFETAMNWTMPDGTACKALLDAHKPGCVIDLKTTKDIAERAFSSASWSAGTHLQMAWYCMATGATDAYLIAQESAAPWDVAVYRVHPLLLEHGRKECLRIVAEYNRCLERGVFPGQQPEPRDLLQPAYADEEVQGVDFEDLPEGELDD
jgi:hypothetical protein